MPDKDKTPKPAAAEETPVPEESKRELTAAVPEEKKPEVQEPPAIASHPEGTPPLTHAQRLNAPWHQMGTTAEKALDLKVHPKEGETVKANTTELPKSPFQKD